MKNHLILLLLLLPLCSGQNYIECYGEDFLLVNNMILKCSGPEPQACYSRGSGEKGCTVLKNCDRPEWTCCHSNLCNA
ncbi:unnamed protein product [Knipowitschia caucasica]|uniref:Uncharacterized protein n=1 Tax=Knipowitschia caucasica TaxID=637954 RepID=A0AAV2JQA6_KNICA